MALAKAGASLPVVGRRLEPLGTVAAMSVWGMRFAPELMSSSNRSRPPRASGEVRQRERDAANEVSIAGLRGMVSATELDVEWPVADSTPPIWQALRRSKYLHRRGVRYGADPVQTLDVWRRKDAPADAPVLVFVPGGAWVHGSTVMQGTALLSRLAEQGWVCLAINYRVSPHNRWPRHIIDVKTAIAWARANVDRFGGDRDFVTVAGCSAGGHLAALAGLTDDDANFATKLPEGADCSVDAVVGIYGRYCWEDRSTPERDHFVDFLEKIVVQRSMARHPEIFRDASPIARVRRDAPPFLVIHGSNDNVIPVAQARSFVERLGAVSASPVNYVELPGAGHAFDMIDGTRAGAMAHATALFLNQVHRTRTQLAKEVI